MGNKNKVTIVVTDSGLGGLSVTAELESKLRERNHFGNIEIIFFNSLASSDFGYNSMPNSQKKAEVFNSALNSIEKLFSPDMILIACNTLSVVYEETEFSNRTKIEVVGIIDLGVEMISEDLTNYSDYSILLLGTPTTINSLSYQKRLINKGFQKDDIINQSCYMLESFIQKKPQSIEVKEMIFDYLNQAKSKQADRTKKILLALCCTHYGYSENLFEQEMINIFQNEFSIINPNHKMVDFVINKMAVDRNNSTKITIKVISQVELKIEEINSISEILIKVSPNTASALKNYMLDKNLFNYKKE